ncbi:MFS transporter [Leucobacter chromiireducens]|uniref:MFS transporter n=1 Tax=Leucobacter chromiireducens TaxID=283877 RepID=UPI0019255ABB
MTETNQTSSPEPPHPEPRPAPRAGSWRDLFSRAHAPAVTVLASGVGLYAMNLYFTAALLPTVVADIGGAEYFAWAATAYLITAVVATMLVSRLLAGAGPARAYALAFALFALGTGVSALSAGMEQFVLGRAIQGSGAGLLTGLGYAVIRGALPPALWTRATGLISAMFGVGTLVGPVLGGAFAEFAAWRAALGTLAVLALALLPVAVRALPASLLGADPSGEPHRPAPVPLVPIATLAAAAAALSLSSRLGGPLVAVAIGGGLFLLVAFLLLDSRHANGVLPRLAYARGGSLKWVYLTVAALCAGVMVENFVPLFAQQIGGLTPLGAGLLGGALSLGWVASQLFSVGAGSARVPTLIRVAPWLLTGGLCTYGLLQIAEPGIPIVLAWALALFIAGAGIGLAFPHLSVAAMMSSSDEREGAKAAAAVSTTQLIAFTLTSALAGNLIALGDGPLSSARWLAFGLTALTALGIATALAATRASRRAQAERP